MIYGFIRDHSDEFAVEKMCQVLEVSRSGYYDWLNRKPSKRTRKNQQLILPEYTGKLKVLTAVPGYTESWPKKVYMSM